MKSWGALSDDEPEASDKSDAAPTWDDAVSLASRVLDQARAAGLSVGTARAARGASWRRHSRPCPVPRTIVMGAVGSYACSVEALLGVEHDTLERVGAVSSQCASEMARGARGALGCDVAVSVTGIAGPGGAVPGKPVGLVWFGVSDGRDAHGVRRVPRRSFRGEAALRDARFELLRSMCGKAAARG